MKIIKIDKRFKVAKEGYVIAVRFDSYSNKVSVVERWCSDTIGGYGMYTDEEWRGYFGHSQKARTPRPYYIAFKNEAYASAVMLAMSHEQTDN